LSVKDPEIHHWALRAAAGAAGLLKTGTLAAATGVALSVGCSTSPTDVKPSPAEPTPKTAATPTAPTAEATPQRDAPKRPVLSPEEEKARQDKISALRAACIDAMIDQKPEEMAAIKKQLTALGENAQMACTPWGPPAPPAYTGARRA